jgi:hypothetical protein
MDSARGRIRKAVQSYRERRTGAHPYPLHRALAALADASTGLEAQIYADVASLVVLGPLRRASDVNEIELADGFDSATTP